MDLLLSGRASISLISLFEQPSISLLKSMWPFLTKTEELEDECRFGVATLREVSSDSLGAIFGLWSASRLSVATVIG